MTMINPFPQVPVSRNQLTPQDVARYITQPAYANEAALASAVTDLQAAAAAAPTQRKAAVVPNTGLAGDFWVDSASGNQLKVCHTAYSAGDGSKASFWSAVSDPTALSAAASALSVAQTPITSTGTSFPSAYTQGWIFVNSSNGYSYICTTTYTASTSAGDRPSKFISQVDAATSAIAASVKSAVDDMGDDEKITPSEKLVLQREWTQIQNNKTSMTSLATALSLTANADYLAAVTAYNNLDTYLNTTLDLFDDLTATENLATSGSSRSEWNTKWTTWYSTLGTFSKTATSSLKTDINLNQSDETITEAEARDYEVRWKYEIANHTNHEAVIDALVAAGLTVKASNTTWTTYDAAYDALDTYLNTTLNLFGVSSWPYLLSTGGSDAAEWRTKWQTYTDAERAMSAVGNTTLSTTLDSYANDGKIDVQEKRGVIQAWNAIYGTTGADGEYQLMSSRAATLIAAGYDKEPNPGLPSKKTALDNAYTALAAYVSSLSPGLLNTSAGDVTVDNAEWDLKWKAYYVAYASLDAATGGIADAGVGLSAGLVDDEIVTAGKEKQELIDLFTNITTEYTYMLSKAAIGVGASTTSYTSAYEALRDYLWGLFDQDNNPPARAKFDNVDIGASGVSRAQWLQNFNTYYEEREALENAILQNNIANLQRDSASLPNMATDGEITSEEKYVAKQYWTVIFGDDAAPDDNGEHAALVAQASALGVASAYTTPFNTAFTLLWNFLTDDSHGTPQASSDPLDLFTNMGVSKTLTAAQQAEWQSAWSDYYAQRDIVSIQITAALQSNLNAKLNRDGTLAMTGNLNMNGHQITGLLSATATGNAVRYDEYNAFLGTTPVATGTANQFSALGTKNPLADADLLLFEDSGNAGAKGKVSIASLRTNHGAPAGVITAFAGSSEPTGWLLCNGATVSQTTYAALYAVIGHTYGADPGGGNFILPNLKGRIPVGLDVAQTEFDSLAETGGAKNVTLSGTEMPSHTHSLSVSGTTSGQSATHTHTDSGHTHPNAAVNTGALTGTLGGAPPGTGFVENALSTGTAAANIGNASGDHTHTVTSSGTSGSSGGDTAHQNMPPYVVMNYIIKT